MDNREVVLKYIYVFLLFTCIQLTAQQIDIPRIESMSNLPDPYHMRDWQKIASGLDSLLFDLQAGGDYLPLIWTEPAGTNYPGHARFGIHSYVGTDNTSSGEAITVLPAVIGATLNGINKSNQNGYNWVLMCEDFFNKRPEENVYLNGFIATSGSDWWYDTMPNVFFYQLCSLYPDQGQFEWQFTMIADRWLEAVEKMGGRTTPWTAPYMNYRAWILSTMKPLTSGVKQPEAAGALAWILYNAYAETGKEDYRIGAEWCMEFLSAWGSNPSYELQLPYGVYAAARMNAELGTQYDIEKLLNWCFTPDGNVREWGMTLGNWGGYDCDGLIGEAVYDGYAFTMNGYEQASALVPMVRYDDRFARAIGKWMLHLANNSRYLYSTSLPAQHQDSENWAYQYDPNGYIAYEALREEQPFSGISPFATGDAINGGWAETNLALYGSAHVGILGAIVDTTNIEKILKLDVLKTDFFGKTAFPTYLLYNPFMADTLVEIDLPVGNYDIYDAVSNGIISSNGSDSVVINLPADNAVLAVLIPAGKTIDYELNTAKIDSIIIDYNAGQIVENYPPRIKSLDGSGYEISIGDSVDLFCTAEDRDGDSLSYNWSCIGGEFTGNGSQVKWTAPLNGGFYNIECEVSDNAGGLFEKAITIRVLTNRPPVIESIKAVPQEVEPLEEVQLYCSADDPEDAELTYDWQASAGTFSGSGDSVGWQAPSLPGYYYIRCTVSDTAGTFDTDSIGLAVGSLVASFCFTGNALDSSGYENHGLVYGADLTLDRFGNPAGAYIFDGLTDHIRIANHPSLNFQNGITVMLWMKINQFYDREAHPVSHGNWENRWKISITDRKIRWTVKSVSGIKDLDTSDEILADRYYHVACVYDGHRYEIYLNGEIDNSSTFSGLISQTSIDLLIGQVLPNNANYNFNGVIDNLMLYNKGLTGEQIKANYDQTVSIHRQDLSFLPLKTELIGNYPNPFNPVTMISYTIGTSYHAPSQQVDLSIYNLLGQKVATLVSEKQSAGNYKIQWNAGDRASGIYFMILKCSSSYSVKKCILVK
ncbi:MAG: T9SS type A sorting domain-containing protein [Calditrichaceae bacterium]|nr:T9SS type A sorting domain-containing protein [Calditrichaceae bacterium]